MRELYAYVTRPSGEPDCLVGVMIQGSHTPLVFANRRVALSGFVRELAQGHADGTGQPVWLVRYEEKNVLESITPKGDPAS